MERVSRRRKVVETAAKCGKAGLGHPNAFARLAHDSLRVFFHPCRSPPPNWSTPAPRDDEAPARSQPVLPAAPASPQIGASPQHAESATNGEGKRSGPPDVIPHAQLDNWQKKMHERFRREMAGQLPEELPPLSPMRSPHTGIREAERHGQHSDPHSSGNHYAAHEHDEVRLEDFPG